MNWIPPKSPFNLIQEHVYHDPWKIFVVCIFCNLTKRVDAEPYMWKFFKKYPTPKDAACADPKEIEEMILRLVFIIITKKNVMNIQAKILFNDIKR